MSRFPWSYLVALAVLVVWLYILSGVGGRDKYELDPSLLSSLSARVDSLQQAVDQENRVLDELRRKADKEESAYRDLEARLRAREKDLNLDHLSALSSSSAGAWPDPIPVLVFACNRKDAVKNHLEQLIRLRPSAERFPIIVSQDCDDAGVAATVKEFGDKVQYIKHIPGAKANISVPVEHRQYTTYYMIARHYKLALDYVFGEKKYGSVIITEDDLDIAVDFFEYFSATRHLLDKDTTLWCVQAWNDNGRPSSIRVDEADRLYRADFFSGLGWMMTSSLWSELSPIWPRGFWDDWLRDPARRKERVCIRPEVSRTGMSAHGKKGASVGRFFSKYLSTVLVNQKSVSFTKMDLSYLEKDKFDRQWEKTVYEDAELLSIEDAMTRTLQGGEGEARAIRVEYNANLDYIQKADKLHIMHDFKAGVPRTAYNGVVSCVVNGVRVYLARDRNTVKEYDPKWEVPSWISD